MEKSLWDKVCNNCLDKADKILQTKTVLNAEEVRTVKELVDIAIAIDMLDLRWAEQTQFGVQDGFSVDS